jgi:hypothetical protein
VFYARKFIPQRYSLGDEGRDDRATVEAKPEDVGDKALIRVLDAQFRGSSGAVLCLRAGVDRLIGHKATSGIPLPWLRPRRCTIFVRIAARCWLLVRSVDVFTSSASRAQRRRG